MSASDTRAPRSNAFRLTISCRQADVGFGTDSNRIARATGYAPGIFYVHVADQRMLNRGIERLLTADVNGRR